MCFQNAHNVSNELAEIVVTSDETELNGTPTAKLAQAAPFRDYRVLELGLVITDTTSFTGSSALRFEVGVGTDSDAFVGNLASGLTIVGNTIGQKFSTAKDFEFRDTPSSPAAAGDSIRIDQDGQPFISAGDTIQFKVNTGTGTPTKAVFYARLAPQIEYKD